MKKILTLVIVIVIAYSCDNKIGLPPAATPVAQSSTLTGCDTVKFSKHIQPILSAYNCTSCHTSSPDFTTYAGTKAKVDDGTFKNRFLVLKDMPQGGPQISAADLAIVQCWLDKGAPNN